MERSWAKKQTLRGMFYAIGGTSLLMLVCFPGVVFDVMNITANRYPFPLFTGILIVVLATGVPRLRDALVPHLDQILFDQPIVQSEKQVEMISQLSQMQDSTRLQNDMLNALCSTLNVKAGFLAFAEPGVEPEFFTIRHVFGEAIWTTGEKIQGPPRVGHTPWLASALYSSEAQAPGWDQIALICNLYQGNKRTGFAAVSERQDGTVFSQEDISFFGMITRHVEATALVASQQGHPHTGVQAQPSASSKPALEIRLLGPFQVSIYGQPVLEFRMEL